MCVLLITRDYRQFTLLMTIFISQLIFVLGGVIQVHVIKAIGTLSSPGTCLRTKGGKNSYLIDETLQNTAFSQLVYAFSLPLIYM